MTSEYRQRLKVDALARRNRIKAKVIFTETSRGIEFTFERKSCGDSWGCGKATFIGE